MIILLSTYLLDYRKYLLAEIKIPFSLLSYFCDAIVLIITVENNCGNLIETSPRFSLINLPLLYLITKGHAVARAVIGE